MSQKASPLTFRPSQVHNPRNAFDLSHHSYFTAPTGMLQPCYTCDLIPGDFVKLDVSNFTRTVPVNTAAFARLTEHVDFYFVPYRLVWRWFDDMIVSMQNTDSAYNPNGVNIPYSVPMVSTSTLLAMLSTTRTDIHGYPLKYFVWRLLDQLGFPVAASYDDTIALYGADGPLAGKQWNPIRLFAFMRLYHDYYRNSDFEVNDPMAYNLDNLKTGASITVINYDPFLNNLGYCYKQWSKDLCTSIKPSSLYQANGVGGPITYAYNGPKGTSVSDGNNVYLSTPVGNEVDVSVNGLRNIFAIDKLARISMLAPKTYRDQLQAHFGVSPDNCQYCSCKFLGSFDSNIQIGDVVATATGSDGTNSNVLGQMAGKGISSGRLNQPINFTASEHGVVIGIHYVQPQSEYDSNQIDQFNIKFSRSDYFIPEFDDLGLQPLTVGQCGVMKGVSGLPENVVGYQSRYIEYKTAVDQCHGLFQSSGTLRNWSISRGNENVLAQGWQTRWLHINPNVTKSIFPMVFNGDPNTDSYLCHYRFDVTKVSNMSVNGIPML